MRLEVDIPTGSRTVTVTYPNSSVMYSNAFSAGLSNVTWNTVTGGTKMPVGVYTAEVTGNSKKWVTELMNIERDNFTLDVPSRVSWGNYLKVRYQSPLSAYLYIVDSGNNIVLNEQVQGINVRSVYTGNLSKANTVLTVRLIYRGVVKAEAKSNLVYSGAGGFRKDETENDLMYNFKVMVYSFVGKSEGSLAVVALLIMAICAILMGSIVKHPLFGMLGALMGLWIDVSADFLPMAYAVVVGIFAAGVFATMMKKG